jgi:hypothetical protein
MSSASLSTANLNSIGDSGVGEAEGVGVASGVSLGVTTGDGEDTDVGVEFDSVWESSLEKEPKTIITMIETIKSKFI